MSRNSKLISPTAHYTGHVWFRNGLSDRRLSTLQGKVFYQTLRPMMQASQRIGGPTLEGFLLARHQLIDLQLEQAIASGEISQVIEVAAGLSPRGLRMKKKFGEKLTYIEADLPGMAALKAKKLSLTTTGTHRVFAIDALQEQGPQSLAYLCEGLRQNEGTAIITEGLLNYFPQPSVEGFWRRFATALSRFPSGLYLSDLHLKPSNNGPLVAAFLAGLSAFVAGKVQLHYEDDESCLSALRVAGFETAQLLKPNQWSHVLESCAAPGANLVSIVKAQCAGQQA
jgi:O-methyltransferase involved in polyketide biosynthesis